MSTVDCAVITNLGHALLGKVLAGKSGIHFTRASVGDGVISEGKSPEELTELVHEIKAGDISGVDNPGSGEVRVSIQVSSLGVSVGFFVKEIGIFATDPDLGEILYAYVSMPDKPQWIRPEGASINTLAIFDVYVAVSRAAEVTAQICPSAMVHISDFESYKTYVETQLSSKAEARPVSIDTEVDIFTLQNGIYRYEGKIPADKNYPPELLTENTVHVSILALDRMDWDTSNKAGYGMLIVCDNLTRVMWHNYKSYGLWRGWRPIATAERPKGYTVALASGINMFTNNSIYKKQNGEVVINLSFASSKEIAHESAIGTLPEGFRPASRIEISFWMRGSAGGTISIGTNGAMTVYKTGNIAANTPCFINSLTYLAAL